jgi:hypothetical protein
MGGIGGRWKCVATLRDDMLDKVCDGMDGKDVVSQLTEVGSSVSLTRLEADREKKDRRLDSVSSE